MDMHFIFPEKTVFKPRLLIKAKGNRYEVTRRRWLQFLALLAYRRLTDIENGSVSLEEIARLSSFHSAERRTIGKYISTTSIEFPPTMNYFIRTCLDINTTGPYALALECEGIDADIKKLENYINWIYKKTTSVQSCTDAVWKTANSALERYELASSRQLFETFIETSSGNRSQPSDLVALAYINLAATVQLATRRSQVSRRLLAKARTAASGIKSLNKRNLILSYMQGEEAFLQPLDRKSIRKTLRINQQAIDTVSEVTGWASDRYCLLGGRHYHRYYVALRSDTESASIEDMKLALHYYRCMQDSGQPRIVHCEPGIIEGTELQIEVIQQMKSRESLNEEYFERFLSLSEAGSISGMIQLAVAHWFRDDLIKSGQLDRAYEFTQRCLIASADYYQTSVYQNMKAKNYKLGKELGYIKTG